MSSGFRAWVNGETPEEFRRKEEAKRLHQQVQEWAIHDLWLSILRPRGLEVPDDEERFELWKKYRDLKPR